MRIRMKRGSPSAPETSVGGWDQPSHDEPPHLASRRPASGSTAFQQSVTLPSAPLRAWVYRPAPRSATRGARTGDQGGGAIDGSVLGCSEALVGCSSSSGSSSEAVGYRSGSGGLDIIGASNKRKPKICMPQIAEDMRDLSFQNPARAGVDPVLLPHPSFGLVCFLSFFREIASSHPSLGLYLFFISFFSSSHPSLGCLFSLFICFLSYFASFLRSLSLLVFLYLVTPPRPRRGVVERRASQATKTSTPLLLLLLLLPLGYWGPGNSDTSSKAKATSLCHRTK